MYMMKIANSVHTKIFNHHFTKCFLHYLYVHIKNRVVATLVSQKLPLHPLQTFTSKKQVESHLCTIALLCILVNFMVLSTPTVSVSPSPLGLNTTSLMALPCTRTNSEGLRSNRLIYGIWIDRWMMGNKHVYTWIHN